MLLVYFKRIKFGSVALCLFFVASNIYSSRGNVYEFSSMVVVCAISACATASAMPINMFAVCAVWIAAGFAINAWRFKFRALDIFSSITVMQFVNMFVFAFYVLLLPVSAENYVEYIKRVACDFAFSGLLLCLCANYCLSLPVCIMSFFGVDIMSTEDVL